MQRKTVSSRLGSRLRGLVTSLADFHRLAGTGGGGVAGIDIPWLAFLSFLEGRVVTG